MVSSSDEVSALGHLDRVDLADEVRDRDVGRRQLLGVAPIAWEPVDRRCVAVALDDGAGSGADRPERIVVELPAGDDRQPLVEQAHERTSHPRLGLAALAQEHHVVAGQDGVLDGRDDRFAVPDDARERLLAGGEPSRAGSPAAPP